MRIVAITTDLMDRSRISGAVDDVAFARDATAIRDADVVVVDLARAAALVGAVRAAAPTPASSRSARTSTPSVLRAGNRRRRRRRAPPLAVLPGPRGGGALIAAT